MKNYGVWCFSDRGFDEVRMTKSNALGVALFCSEEDELGAKNYAVIQHTDDFEPIWHKMEWCGQFQGYKTLFEQCVEFGEVKIDDSFDIDDLNDDGEGSGFSYV